jgi:hypothetical protein
MRPGYARAPTGTADACGRVRTWSTPLPPRRRGTRPRPTGSVDEVCDHAGDVVRTAALVRQRDEAVDCVRGLGDVGEDLVDLVVVQHRGHSVRADEEPVADAPFHGEQVGFGWAALLQGADEDRAARMVHSLVRGEPALVDQALH